MTAKEYLDVLEWESIKFPLELTNVQSKHGYYNLPKDLTIKVWRDDQLRIRASIHGVTNDRHVGDYKFEGRQGKPGEVLQDEIFTGEDTKNNYTYELTGCYLTDVKFNQLVHNDSEAQFSIILKTDKIVEVNNNSKDSDVSMTLDFFLTGKSNLRFPGNTSRYIAGDKLRIRHSIDQEESLHADIKNFTGGSWDHFYVITKDFSFVVQTISEKYLPSWASGLLIEYRSEFGFIPTEEMRKKVYEIIGFILGTELIKVGSSELGSNRSIVARTSLDRKNLIDHCSRFSIRPMRYKKEHFRHQISEVANILVQNYIELRDDLNLNIVLWKYWVSKKLAIGDNLPILSSALEGLAKKYIKFFKLVVEVSETEKESYSKYLEENKAFLEGLSQFSFGESLIGKIVNPYNLGSNERLKVFFKALNISIVKKAIENQALVSRNHMAHTTETTSSKDDESIKALKLSRAYESFFNRVFLKTIGHTGTYTDFYTLSHPELDINKNIEG